MMDALILMSRVPIPGKTKTRLMEILTGDECAGIHQSFLLDLFHIFQFLKKDIHIFLTYTPERSINKIEGFIPHFINCFPQKGKSLGERMANAFQHVFEQGYHKIILMGSDIPDIQPFDIRNAFEKLNDHDICLGPTFDGGYYLIGMKSLYAQLFDDHLKWGNKSVFEGTVDIANSAGLKVGLAAKHRDIDTKEDLIEFMKRVDKKEFKNKILPRNTIEFIQNCWSDKYYAQRHIKG
ncbi:MAG: uncharacterized protein PWP27_1013 [Clostridiales bacterium]|jgi:hypothetical protein|nr:uncharacterized protein [Clostridiales bacterium]MDK2933203.1 uncharacterized protein [Clostridiales bacterium]